ncbi:hypothetical protein [Methylobacterium sp. CM6247]
MRPKLQELVQEKIAYIRRLGHHPTINDYMNAVIEGRTRLRDAFSHPAAGNDDSDVIELELPAHVLRRAPSKVGQTENFRPRTSASRDRRNRDRTAPYFRQEVAARRGDFSSNPLPPSSSLPLPDNDDHPSACNDNPHPKSKATKRREAQDARDTRLPPDWKRTGDTGKLTACNRAVALGDHGTARAFTLNLSPDVVSRGLASSHSGFAPWMQKRLHREIVAAVGHPLPFVFGVDVTRTGRPHLHGMIAANDDHLEAIGRACRKAGGEWKAGHAEKQAHLGLVWDSDGWSRYGERNLAAARKVVGQSVIAGTGSLKAAARELHERLRTRLREDKISHN